MKYKEWLPDWLELYQKESVKPRTYKQYEDVISHRLIPSLGEYEMDDLTPIVLQRFIVELSQNGNTKSGKGLAPNSVNSIILVLHSSLSMAYILGLTKTIYVDKIKRPKASEKPIESFTKSKNTPKQCFSAYRCGSSFSPCLPVARRSASTSDAVPFLGRKRFHGFAWWESRTLCGSRLYPI